MFGAYEMISRKDIEIAFKSRLQPEKTTDVDIASTLRYDALHFQGKNWRDITVEDWNLYSDAYFGLNPEAFLFFLPSLLSLALPELANGPYIVDALIGDLDTSGVVENWNDFFLQRFASLTGTELDVLSLWIGYHRQRSNPGREDELKRAARTVLMLRQNYRN